MHEPEFPHTVECMCVCMSWSRRGRRTDVCGGLVRPLLTTNLFHDITLLIAVLKEGDVFCAPGGLGMIKMMIFTLGNSPGLSKDSNPAQAAVIGFRQLDYLSDFNYHNLPAELNRYNSPQMLYLELPWHERLSCFFFFFYQRINIWKTALIMQRYTLCLQDPPGKTPISPEPIWYET